MSQQADVQVSVQRINVCHAYNCQHPSKEHQLTIAQNTGSVTWAESRNQLAFDSPVTRSWQILRHPPEVTWLYVSMYFRSGETSKSWNYRKSRTDTAINFYDIKANDGKIASNWRRKENPWNQLGDPSAPGAHKD